MTGGGIRWTLRPLLNKTILGFCDPPLPHGQCWMSTGPPSSKQLKTHCTPLSTRSKQAAPSVSCQDGKPSIYIIFSDKELVFCSTFNHSFTILGKGTASSLCASPWEAAMPGFLSACCVTFHLYNLSIHILQDSRNTLRFLRTTQYYYFKLLKERPGTTGRTVFWCSLPCICMHQEPLPSTGHCYLCTNRFGHVQMLWGHGLDTRVLNSFLHFLSQP